MSTFLYTRPSENLLTTATLTVNSGVEDATYPKANLVDLHPEKPAKLTGTSGSWVADLGSAKAPEICAIIHHSWDAGVNVRLQGNASNTWGAPSVDLPFTMPAVYADGFRVNVWLNLKALIPVAASRTYRYWRLVGVGVNSIPVSVGQWVMYSLRRDLTPRNIKRDSTRMLKRPSIIHETELFARRIYDLGTTMRTVEFEIDPTDATLAEVYEWFRDARGTALPFLIVPHSEENDAWFVTFVDPEVSHTRKWINYNPAKLTLMEASRGLFP